MKIIKPYARMIQPASSDLIDQEEEFDKQLHGIGLLQRIEWAARISHRAEDACTNTSWERIIKHVVLEHGDWSVVEHATVSVDMVVDRGISHEWVRHRLFGFTQESTRFVNYEKKMPPSFIYPQVGVDCKHCLSGHKHIISGSSVHWIHNQDLTGKSFGNYDDCPYDTDWLTSINQAECSYKELLVQKGWRPQEARSVFPNALATRIVTTGNLRNWRHVLIMRTTQETHPQMRQVMIPLLAEFKEKIPLLFDDIEPNQKQSIAIRKPR